MEKLKNWWLDFFQSEKRNNNGWWERKKVLNEERNVEIAAIQGDGRIYRKMSYDDQTIYHYLLHLAFLIKQADYFYMEEHVIPFHFQMREGDITKHSRLEQMPQSDEQQGSMKLDKRADFQENRFVYDRLAAVKYAERWWNSYNPVYNIFDVDCTNYVSQCLHAGGASMRGAPERNKGWWHDSNNWSYSWSVAHSLRWYLSGSTLGLKGKEMQEASELSPGDVICYDFQGDGRWDHTTIVVAKDAYGMPLVNAHTENSRNRYWSYEDSTAWTPDIAYKFFRIGES